jgi:SAM-dependent methyltransferase
MTTPLGLTGERTVPGVPSENYWFRRHERVYAAVPGWAPRPTGLALDAGSGEGYGVSRLAAALPGCRVLGLDYDPRATAHAAHTYAGRHTAYARAGLTALPLADDTADLVVSLQVVEHIWSPGDYVRELARVCRPGGSVVLSTPNRLTFSPGLGRRERPDNAFHCREYDAEELTGAVPGWAPELEVTAVLGLRHGPRLADWEARHGSIVTAQLTRSPADWEPALAVAVSAVEASDFVLTPDALDAGLDLVVVAARRGGSVRQTSRS